MSRVVSPFADGARLRTPSGYVLYIEPKGFLLHGVTERTVSRAWICCRVCGYYPFPCWQASYISYPSRCDCSPVCPFPLPLPLRGERNHLWKPGSAGFFCAVRGGGSESGSRPCPLACTQGAASGNCQEASVKHVAHGNRGPRARRCRVVVYPGHVHSQEVC